MACACLDTSALASLEQTSTHKQLNKVNQKAKMLAERITFSLFVVLFSSLFYYGKQKFFVVKVKVYVAIGDNL